MQKPESTGDRTQDRGMMSSRYVFEKLFTDGAKDKLEKNDRRQDHHNGANKMTR